MSTKGKAALGGSAGAAGNPPKTTGAATRVAPAATAASVPASSARAASRARRQAMSQRGKVGVGTQDRVRSASTGSVQAKAQASSASPEGCGCGCKQGKRAEQRPDSRRTPAAGTLGSTASAVGGKGQRNMLNRATKPAPMSVARAASLARRRAMSTRGKAGLSANGMTQAQTARAANPNMTGRELAQTLRTQRSQKGSAGQKKSAPCGRKRGNGASSKGTTPGAAQDAPWKVGASETVSGQTVTGTQVGRSMRTTGDEYSTCRAVTGTEYMGADIFRQFCQSEPTAQPSKVRVSPTGHGNTVTGNEVGRSSRVTGDEPGTCKRVTGSQYVGANQSEIFCATPTEAGPRKISRSETRKGKSVTGNNVGRSNRVTGDETGAGRELTGTQYMQSGEGQVPPKVGSSQTLRGGAVTGVMVGRSERVTGDEPGSCRNVTGDDYVGQEQYTGFCGDVPKPADRKVGMSQTSKGRQVSGTMTGRSGKVTGDEPGTCKAITGTPYAGAEQYRSYCDPAAVTEAVVRTRPQRSTPAAAVMTGQQPGIGGKLTGAGKGACEPVSGTPYIGADQYGSVCPAAPAEPGSPDFPQALGDETPWGKFSVNAPVHAAQTDPRTGNVTGAVYEQGNITGPFGMATGKVTGTEEARFGRGSASSEIAAPSVAQAETVDGRVKSRITGEGMDAGTKITGDDWDRGDRVTGTEGMSSMRRNPTRRGSTTSAMPSKTQVAKRNEEVPEPISKVTGGSGNTERGALVTYSGGARG